MYRVRFVQNTAYIQTTRYVHRIVHVLYSIPSSIPVAAPGVRPAASTADYLLRSAPPPEPVPLIGSLAPSAACSPHPLPSRFHFHPPPARRLHPSVPSAASRSLSRDRPLAALCLCRRSARRTCLSRTTAPAHFTLFFLGAARPPRAPVEPRLHARKITLALTRNLAVPIHTR